MRTAGTFEQDSPQTDGVIFIGASEFLSPTLANTGLTIIGPGLVPLLTPASATTNLFKAIDQILRTGVLNSQALGYAAFGTTGPPPVPGPSSVANTSGPSAILGHPPTPKASLATITGGVRGAFPKGLQINYVDFIYTVLGAGATSISAGLTQTKFGAAGAGATAAVKTDIITFGTNGLPTAVAANPVTTRVNVPAANQTMLTSDENEVLLQFQTVNPAGCTVQFYGAKLGVYYNLN